MTADRALSYLLKYGYVIVKNQEAFEQLHIAAADAGHRITEGSLVNRGLIVRIQKP